MLLGARLPRQAPTPKSIPVPEATLSPNYEPDPIAAHPQGLSQSTVYRLHVGAQLPGETLGEEVIFTDAGAGPGALRPPPLEELVAPADKRGATLQTIAGAGLIQAAVSGDVVSTLANAPTEAEPQGFPGTVQILSRRGASAWESNVDAPRSDRGLLRKAGIPSFQDLQSAIVDPLGPFTQAISAQASERTPYCARTCPPGDPAHPCHAGCYRPLVSGCPEVGEPCPAAVQEVGERAGGDECGGGEGEVQMHFLGASADARHVVLSSVPALSEEAPSGEEGEVSLYGVVGGELSLVDILPGGQAVEPASEPELGFFSESGGAKIARHAISKDGNRVIFSEQRGSRRLYLRDMARERSSIQLDAQKAPARRKANARGGAPGLPGRLGG